MKKLLGLFLSLAMVISALPLATIHAEIDETTILNPDAASVDADGFATGVYVKSFSSDIVNASTGENGSVANILDKDGATYWHSNYQTHNGTEHSITFDLNGYAKLSAVSILPRQSEQEYNGDILAAKLLAGNDLESLAEVGTYTFETEEVSNKWGYSQQTVVNRDQYQPMEIAEVNEVRYVKLVVVSSSGDSGNDKFASCGDINFYGTEFNVKKETLKTAIDNGNAVDETLYTADSYADLSEAITNGQNVYDDANAKQVKVDAMSDAINEAIESLVPLSNVNKDALNEKIEEANALDTTNKTEESKQALEDAITAAEAISAKEDATQEEVDEALENLQDAMDGLTDNSAVDKSALEDKIDEANGLNQDKLTDESAKALQDAIDAATEIKNDEDATQEEVDAAVEALNKAIKSIVIALPFIDVKENDWFYKVVADAYFEGLMGATGKGSEYFEPDTNISRGMVATVLYRMAGLPKTTYVEKFPDVNNPAMWYATAITWASSEKVKVVSGYGNGSFGPDDNITRQDLAIMLRNYATFAGLDTKATADLTSFMDDDKIDGYAKSAVEWCVANKIITGSTKADGTYLQPRNNATRAECAKMFTLLQDLCE